MKRPSLNKIGKHSGIRLLFTSGFCIYTRRTYSWEKEEPLECGDILTESNNCHPSAYSEVQAEEKQKEGEKGRGEEGDKHLKTEVSLSGIWGSNFISPRLVFILTVFWIREINSAFFALSVHQTEVCLFTVTENSDKGDLPLSGQLLLPYLWQASCVRQIWTCLIECAPLSSVSMDAQRICWGRSC